MCFIADLATDLKDQKYKHIYNVQTGYNHRIWPNVKAQLLYPW